MRRVCSVPDEMMHGIQNVQSVVDKYGGTLDIKQEGGMFIRKGQQ